MSCREKPLGSTTAHLARTIDAFSKADWQRISGNKPFASATWFRFLEACLVGPRPLYVARYDQLELAAAAVCWPRRHVYIPTPSARLRAMATWLLRRFPLLSCENPLTESSGLFPPEAASILAPDLCQAGLAHGCAWLGYDYLADQGAAALRASSPSTAILPSEPVAVLDLPYPSFEAYLTAISARKRKNVRRELRQAESLGYRIVIWERFAPHAQAMYALAQAVHHHHGETQMPVSPAVYELAQAHLPGSRAIAVLAHDEIVACELLLRDGDELLPKLVGLDYAHAPLAYNLLYYAEIRYAIEHGASRIHMGSTTQAFKRRLGCHFQSRHYGLCNLRAPWMTRAIGRLLEGHDS